MKTARPSVLEAPDRPKLKVAVLSRVFSRTGGGAEAYSIAVVEQLAATHELHVFAQEINHQHEGVSYHRVSSPGKKPRWLNQLWFAYATWRQTRQGFDVVHSHENTWHGQIQTIHVRPLRSNVLGDRKGWPRVLAWLKIAFSPRLTTYVALEAARFRAAPGRQVPVASESLRREVLAVYPQAEPLLCVLPPGVHMPEMGQGGELPREPTDSPSAPARSERARTRGARAWEARTRWGAPTDAFVLLLVANDFARKGLDTLLEALALLPSNAILFVAGNDQNARAYGVKASKLGISEDRLRFLGPLADIGLAYAAADALVHPTLEDSFGMVVLEAMAHGLAVVVSGPAFCGAADLLTNEVNALVLPDPHDAASIAAALRRLLDDPTFAARLVQQASIIAAAHSWEAVAARYAALYLQSLQPL